MPLSLFRPRTAAVLLSLAALAAVAQPKAALLHSAPREWKPNEVLLIDGSLAGTSTFAKLVVRYRGPGEEYVDLQMELQYGDLYRGTIPATRMRPPGIEYYVEGVSESGERTPIFMSAAKPARVLVMGEDPAGAAEPKEAPPAPKEKPKKKCKKNDRKCLAAEAAAAAADAAAEREAKKADAAAAAAAKKTEAAAAAAAAKKEEPAPLQVKEEPPPPKKEEPPPPKKEEPPAAPSKKENGKKKAEVAPPAVEEEPKNTVAPARPEPPRKKTELEEELAIYNAEYASGVVTRVDEKTSRVSQSVSTYPAAMLKQLGARTVYDVLDLVPGLTVSRDVQGFHRVAVRGIRNDADVLFLLDGHALNNFYDGRALANLPIDNLEKIEVYRGPANAAFGFGNFLAVINLVTRRDDGLRASGSAGLWETFAGHLGGAKTFGGLKLFLDGDVLHQVGYKKPVLKDALDINTVAQGKRLASEPAGRTNDSRLLVNVGGGAEFTRDGFGTLSLAARFLLESRGALIGQYDTLGNDSTLDWNALLIDLKYDRKLGEASKLKVRFFYDQQATRRHFQLSPRDYTVTADSRTAFPNGILEELSVSTRSFGGDLGVELALPANNRLSLGVTAGLASLSGYDLLTNYEVGTNFYRGATLLRPEGLVYPTESSSGAASRFGLGLYVQDVFTPFERLAIEAGVRVDLVQLPGGLTPGFGPRVGIVFAPLSSLSLRAHYGRAFATPTVQQLAETIPNSDSNQGRFVGNLSLQPQYVDSVDLGFDYAQTVGEARVKVRAGGFFQNFSNPIMPVDTSGNLVPYTNRPQGVRVFGAEGEARVELSQRSAVFVNASFFRAEDNASVPAARLLTDTPQARLNAGFSLPLGPYLNFDVTGRFAAERRNNSRSTLELIRRYRLPGYALVGAALRTEPIFDHVELAVVGQNVFDFDYADDVPRPDRITAGVPREGVLVFATVKVEF